MEAQGESLNKIRKYIRQDKEIPDLTELIKNQIYTPDKSVDDQPQLGEPTFSEHSTVRFPEAVFDLYRQTECHVGMGLFAAINRAWITIDNQIIMWNYAGGGVGRNLVVYDHLDQIIVSAALVVPKPDVFISSEKYLLVLATPVEVIVLGVSFENNDLNSDITLHPTTLFVSSGNVLMLKIIGTDSGRIFMCGKDGCLYELDYQADESWFRSKTRRLNHSTSRLSMLLPSFLRFGAGDPLIDFAVDDSRHILYTLSEKGVIQVFDLGADGTAAPSKVAALDVAAHPDVVADFQQVRVLTISAVPATESGLVHLVATTCSAIRLYFTTYPEYPTHDRPTTLELVAVRVPPPMVSARPGAGAPVRPQGQGEVLAAFHQQGVFLYSEALSEDTGRVVAVARERFLSEAISKVCNGYLKVFAVAEVAQEFDVFPWAFMDGGPHRGYAPPYLIEPSALRSYNELALQHIAGRRTFVCMTNHELHFITKRSPLDQLEALLLAHANDSGTHRSEALEAFINNYSRDQVCAMCLTLVCPHLSSTGGHSDRDRASALRLPLHDTGLRAKVANAATWLFFNIQQGSTLGRRDSAYGAGAQQGRRIEENVAYSSHHNGAFIYFARLVANVWDKPLVYGTPGGRAARMGTHLTRRQWEDLREQLACFDLFFEKYPPRRPPPPPVPGIPLPVDVERELKSFESLSVVLKRTIEAHALWALLAAADFEKLVAQLSSESQERLLKMTFEQFVFEETQLPKQLIQQLLATATATHNVEAMCRELRERCSLFFSQKDRAKESANETVSRARAAAEADRPRLLDAALRLYCDAADAIDEAEARAICEKFYSFDIPYFRGVVQLALALAAAADPRDLATAQIAGRELEARQLLANRERFYKLIVGDHKPSDPPQAHYKGCLDRLLEEMNTNRGFQPGVQLSRAVLTELRDETYRACFESRDRVFHGHLCKWFRDNRLTQDLLSSSADWLPALLRSRGEVKDLADYYSSHQNHAAAAELYVALVDQCDNLEDRVNYLARAILERKSVAKGSAPTPTDLQLLQDKMDLARIQLRMLHELEEIARVEFEYREIVQNACVYLNSSLCSANDLYTLSTKFDLWELQLAILHDTQSWPPHHIEKCWHNILASFAGGGMLDKIVALGRLYYPSPTFPLEYICRILELHYYACERNDPSASACDEFETRTVYFMRQVGVPLEVLYEHYKALLRHADFQGGGEQTARRRRLYRIIHQMISEKLQERSIPRLVLNQLDEDLVKIFLVDLGALSGAQPELDKFRQLQTQIRRAQTHIQKFP